MIDKKSYSELEKELFEMKKHQENVINELIELIDDMDYKLNVERMPMTTFYENIDLHCAMTEKTCYHRCLSIFINGYDNGIWLEYNKIKNGEKYE